MNKHTNQSQFIQSPNEILKESELLIPDNCMVFRGVLYERLKDNDYKYRFFFSNDDYEYLVNYAIENKLNDMWIEVDAEEALYQQELKE
jgi:hypothetical protein